ncbi:hypothetical protein [Streptomyces chiangmaiensis]|uniref:Uncharacterized protein n=1 Tax=Streptomyces chiangmaiensis TaxID=766497 RepID=A0ABU7FGC5_9ACTN|nr:hypothetical protein [Streptomyces chiangmaiensis]MED7823130.1 hypothetical protein [Streptomyces chiangmaiensis]
MQHETRGNPPHRRRRYADRVDRGRRRRAGAPTGAEVAFPYAL